MSEYIRRDRKNMKDWKLTDLRTYYPHIKSNSKEKFLDKLDAYWEEQDRIEAADKLAEEIMDMPVDYEEVEPTTADRIKAVVPDYFNKALATETGCECWEDNQIWFQFVMKQVNGAIQDAIIRLGQEKLGMKWYKRTTCPPCIRDRVDKVKEYFNQHFIVTFAE